MATETIDVISSPPNTIPNYWYPIMMGGTQAPIGRYDTVPDAVTKWNAGAYNLGMYLFRTDENGWDGGVLRILKSKWYQPEKVRYEDLGILMYDSNTGVRVRFNSDVHITVAMAADGWMEVFINGGKVKDFRYNLPVQIPQYGTPGSIPSPVSNGGAGINQSVRLFGGHDGTVFRTVTGAAYSVKMWNGVKLTRQQVKEHYLSEIDSARIYSGPAPTKAYDFTRGDPQPDVVGGKLIPAPLKRVDFPVFSSNVSGGGKYGQAHIQDDGSIKVFNVSTNPRVYTPVAQGGNYLVTTSITYNQATAITLRASVDGEPTGAFIDYFTQTGSGAFIRTDPITIPNVAGMKLWWVATMPSGAGAFIIRVSSAVVGV